MLHIIEVEEAFDEVVEEHSGELDEENVDL